MPGHCLRIAIIGMGPRGLSVLERLCANVAEFQGQDIEIHLVDPHLPGSGSVWRTGQSRCLLANTIASQITMFTDASVDCAGPHVPGPSLYEWARFITLVDFENYSDAILEEARKIQPNSYPSRVLYGYYLEWVYRQVFRNLPDNVNVRYHQSRAVALDDGIDGQQVISLENESEPLLVDAVVLALGHTSTTLSGEEKRLLDFANENGLCYVPPANPADADLNLVKAGEAVILRGLGLNFFDYMALLTIGRGGRFVRQQGRLVYEASGQEPRMVAGSRRGIPYHARAENEKGPFGRHQPLILTPEVISKFLDRATRGEKIHFRSEVWPLLAKEVETLYYSTLIHTTSCKYRALLFQERYLKEPWGSEKEKQLLDEFGISRADRWSWERLPLPYGNMSFNSQEEFRVWLIEYLYRDLFEAQKGNISGPLKAALDALRDLRNEMRIIVDHGRLSGESYRDDLQNWFTPLNAFLSIGPPASRIEQMIALIEAGILDVLGPDLKVEPLISSARFRAYSPRINDSEVEAAVLIEARMPDINLNRSANPLLTHLMQTEQCRPYVITNPDGSGYETGGLAVTTPPNRLINRNGTVHPRRFAFGVPTEGVHWVTGIGIRPGVNSVLLTDSDAIARAVLGITSDTGSKQIKDLSRI